jgi:Glycosyl transferases group 1
MGAGGLRHVLLTVRGSHGFQYGMLRDFEEEIVRLTGASVVPIPPYRGPAMIVDRLAHGTRYAPLRRLAPRQRTFGVDADVLWLVLMGPESSWLDLYRAWDARVGYRIVYVYDAFPEQLPALRRLVAAAKWDLMITAFHCCVPMLERETGRPWAAVAMGVKAERFAPVPAAERGIAVSSYGRRVDTVNRALAAFCDAEGLYFDATVAATLQRSIPSAYLYNQYAWHLRHSRFTVAWPIDLTSPKRAGGFSPVTCRWFEAAASATTLLGRPPADPVFETLFGAGAVVLLDPAVRSEGEFLEAFRGIWERREEHHRAATARREERLATWTWEARVKEMLMLARIC